MVSKVPSHYPLVTVGSFLCLRDSSLFCLGDARPRASALTLYTLRSWLQWHLLRETLGTTQVPAVSKSKSAWLLNQGSVCAPRPTPGHTLASLKQICDISTSPEKRLNTTPPLCISFLVKNLQWLLRVIQGSPYISMISSYHSFNKCLLTTY